MPKQTIEKRASACSHALGTGHSLFAAVPNELARHAALEIRFLLALPTQGALLLAGAARRHLTRGAGYARWGQAAAMTSVCTQNRWVKADRERRLPGSVPAHVATRMGDEIR